MIEGQVLLFLNSYSMNLGSILETRISLRIGGVVDYVDKNTKIKRLGISP
jgi:hypothetical protein